MSSAAAGVSSRRHCRRNGTNLLRVELDDQLLANGHGEVLARRVALDPAGELLLVELEPAGDAAAIDGGQAVVDARDLAAAILDRHHVVGAHEVRGDVDVLAVDREVAVAHELARLRVVPGEAETI